MRICYCPLCGDAYAMVDGDGLTHEERYGITPACCFIDRFKLLQRHPHLNEKQLAHAICLQKNKPIPLGESR